MKTVRLDPPTKAIMATPADAGFIVASSRDPDGEIGVILHRKCRVFRRVGFAG